MKATSGPAGSDDLVGAVVFLDLMAGHVAGDVVGGSAAARLRHVAVFESDLPSFDHACHIRRLPRKMLAAVERDHLAGDRARLPEISYRRAEFAKLRPALEQQPVDLRVEVRCGCWLALCSVGPGPMALTRTLGASACASVCVAVHSADFDSV